MQSVQRRAIVAGVALLVAMVCAHAEDRGAAGPDPDAGIPALRADGGSAQDDGDGFAAAHALDPAELAGQRGGALASDSHVEGAVGGNQASNLSTGSNAISSGAFANSSGLPLVIQNSGNNVLIQNSTIVNVQMK